MSRLTFLVAIVLGAGCVTEVGGTPEGEHEDYDFAVEDEDGKADGISATFDMHLVIRDEVFTDGDAITTENLQRFLEETPYDNRSWLAGATIEGVPASQFIVNVAREHEIHPLVLLARMQVEASIVSKTVKPSQRLVDRALGCGCPDGGTCSSEFKGIANQLRCGGATMRRWFDASIDGSGEWRLGRAKKTLDPKTVTPKSHATASLYAYTPWVLVGRGGNWLVWNVSRKYVRYAELNGLVATP